MPDMTAAAGVPLRPPFTHDTAVRKVRAAEDAWNTRDPQRVSLAYGAIQPRIPWARNESEARGPPSDG